MATPTHPDIPPRVVSGELITSAWGNQVVDLTTLLARTMNGTPNPGTATPGGQVQISTINLPAGAWIVMQQVVIVSVGPVECVLRMFVNGAFYTDTRATGSVAASGTYSAGGRVLGLAASDVAFPVTVSLLNFGPADASVGADSSNHRIFAIGGRSL